MPEPDYQRYLGQSDIWPSESKDSVKIYSMAHGHAINALHKLLEWGKEDDRWGGQPEMHLRRTPLALALLKQAVGEPVVYADDIRTDGPMPDAVRPQRPATTGPGYAIPLRGEYIDMAIDLETCWDALEALEEYDNRQDIATHPVTRARILFRALTDSNTAT